MQTSYQLLTHSFIAVSRRQLDNYNFLELSPSLAAWESSRYISLHLHVVKLLNYN